uniref:Uncharacterized protein n=1 Tax=Mus spicilegus TaxID=10103 RepID=A0A8C6HIB3_MUSSI
MGDGNSSSTSQSVNMPEWTRGEDQGRSYTGSKPWDLPATAASLQEELLFGDKQSRKHGAVTMRLLSQNISRVWQVRVPSLIKNFSCPQVSFEDNHKAQTAHQLERLHSEMVLL